MPQIELFLQCFPTDPILKNICPSTKKEKKKGRDLRESFKTEKTPSPHPKNTQRSKGEKKNRSLISRSIQNYLVHFIVLFNYFQQKRFFLPPFCLKALVKSLLPVKDKCKHLLSNDQSPQTQRVLQRHTKYTENIFYEKYFIL